MQKDFTKAEKIAWLAAQPKKPLSAKLLVFNARGELLLVKPNYKPGWDIIGGMLDEGESPLAAVIRETKEEINISLEPQRFTFMAARYGVSRESEGDFVHFIFKVTLSDDEIARIILQDDEIMDQRWAIPAEVATLLAGNLTTIIVQILEGATGIYSENDQFVI